MWVPSPKHLRYNARLRADPDSFRLRTTVDDDLKMAVPEVSDDFFNIVKQKKKKYDELQQYYEKNPDKKTSRKLDPDRDNRDTLAKWLSDFEKYKEEQEALGEETDYNDFF